MQAFKAKIGKLSDVLTGYGISEKEMISEEVFVSALKDQEQIYLKDENKNEIGYFDKFWVETIGDIKYLCGSGVVFKEEDFNRVEMFKNFEKMSILMQKMGNYEKSEFSEISSEKNAQ